MTAVVAEKFLSTPSARRATANELLKQAIYCISIHALREEGDHGFNGYPHGGKHISIHALREEGDLEDDEAAIEAAKFLSTPSARRATSLWHPCTP